MKQTNGTPVTTEWLDQQFQMVGLVVAIVFFPWVTLPILFCIALFSSTFRAFLKALFKGLFGLVFVVVGVGCLGWAAGNTQSPYALDVLLGGWVALGVSLWITHERKPAQEAVSTEVQTLKSDAVGSVIVHKERDTTAQPGSGFEPGWSKEYDK